MSQSSKVTKTFGSVTTSAVVPSHQVMAVSTGQTVSIPRGVAGVIATSPSTLSALTVNLPVSPTNGQTVFFSPTHTITSATVATTDSSTVAPSYTASLLGAGVSLRYIYNTATTSWYQI